MYDGRRCARGRLRTQQPCRRDLPSAARVLEASDTNGVELFDMELDTLVDDLRVSRFHARRVLAARDAFLYGSAK